MAKKLIFQKSGGNNISIDEEGLTANTWTEATFSDFGTWTPVEFGNNVYVNTTGTFIGGTPPPDPATDTTNWTIICSGSHVRSITIEEETTTGIVTVTITDTGGTVTVRTFQAGHQITMDGGSRPYRPTLDFRGSLTVLDNPASNRTEIVLPQSAKRLEDLTDVDITDQTNGKIIISRSGPAYFQFSPNDLGNTIYELETSNGLMFSKPDGSTPLINETAIAFALNRGNNDVSYLILDGAAGDQLLVEMSFSGSTITITDFIDRAVLALSTDWGDGTGTADERTVTDQMAGGTLINRNGVWSKADNPAYIDGIKAKGTSIDLVRDTNVTTSDCRFINFSITGRSNGTLIGSTSPELSSFGNTNVPLATILTEGVDALNANTTFNAAYTAFVAGNAIRVEAKTAGAGDNGVFNFAFVSSLTPFPATATYLDPAADTVTITGGQDISGEQFALRWTNTPHATKITEPTLENPSAASTAFRQGGFAWIDETPTLNTLSDVNINIPDPGSQQLQILRSDFFGNFNNIDARIENLNVSGIASSLKQGTLLQYAPAGVGEWIHAGLRDDGSGNFTETPLDGQFLRFNQTGGVGEAWEAFTAALNDLSDVDTVTTPPKEGDILKFQGGIWVPAEEIVSGTGYLGIQSFTENIARATTTGFLNLFPIGRSPSFEAPNNGTFLKVLRTGTYAILGRLSILLQTADAAGRLVISLEINRDGAFFTQLDVVIAELATPPADGSSTASIELHTIEELGLLAGDELRIRFTATQPGVTNPLGFAWNYAAEQKTIDFLTVTRLD